jgi:hypothetical protein
MSQLLDDGKTIAFGQSLEEVEQLFGCEAVDIPIKIARKGIDKSLKTDNISLEFDSGKLKRMSLEAGYEFKNPLTPYPEPWKNFPAIGATRISGQMFRRIFLSYLKAWDARARNLGGRRIQAGEDLADREYSIAVVRDDFADMIVVNMGPSRRAGGGGLWCDGWCLFFATESDHQRSGVEVGRLQSLSAFRDEFNTVARRITASPRT